uniref:Uncharacterized protein n=1 Tax=Setaria italica TaxID=4555 RepID=K4A3W6_SETIT
MFIKETYYTKTTKRIIVLLYTVENGGFRNLCYFSSHVLKRWFSKTLL